ncbi:unnamed protein product [Heligmosomoides polygyrus]|uniref:Craniofacial development protein 2-like n=1 Tax=Heligmosomoides polygyrus TaxID=6339 RepID=A0A183F7F6_HELPZ|nr:unnamed protein product [Heligmosomoides polygyrus]
MPMVAMSVPPRGATGNCFLLRAELNTDIRMQATGEVVLLQVDVGRGFKAVLCGSPRTTSGVGIIVSERFDDRLMKIIVAVEERRSHFFSAYAPQTGCSEQTKDGFWSLLDEKTAEISSQDMVVVAGDLSGHVGATKDGYSCHDGLETVSVYLSMQTHMIIVDTKFRNCGSHLISFCSRNAETQVDYVLVGRRDQGLVTGDAKTVPYETVATQHLPRMITVSETEAALKKMKSGKATGPDDLPADLWRSKGWCPADWLTEFFNQVVAVIGLNLEVPGKRPRGARSNVG